MPTLSITGWLQHGSFRVGQFYIILTSTLIQSNYDNPSSQAFMHGINDTFQCLLLTRDDSKNNYNSKRRKLHVDLNVFETRATRPIFIKVLAEWFQSMHSVLISVAYFFLFNHFNLY